jgi:NAD(P)-dependent dehydrogenase (short-subunit alcohol dehydrogenase family)
MPDEAPQPLLEPHQLGDLLLPNRVVMAPLTRGRARNPEHVPNDLMREYYEQRSTAGLTAVYSSTKAALHSFVLSQRYRLQGTSVRVLEIAPPWVQTDLLNSSEDPRAMPLKAFIDETIAVLGTDAEEILVEQAKPFRNNPGPNESALVTQFNDVMVAAKPR